MILTTEDGCDAGGQTLQSLPLIWVGAPGGSMWKQRPLRLAYEPNCLFRGSVTAALDAADIPWEMAVESDSTRTIEASVCADLAVHTALLGMEPPYMERIAHGGNLPELPGKRINLYVSELAKGTVPAALADLIRQTYMESPKLQVVSSSS